MQHMEQLKKIRAEAIARLRASEDFKLAVKLGQLIVEMGDSIDEPIDLMGQKGASSAPAASAPRPLATPTSAPVSSPVSAAPSVSSTSSSSSSASSSDELDTSEIIDELVSEMESDGTLGNRDPFSTARSSSDSKSVNGIKS